jgi:hypothetical protein
VGPSDALDEVVVIWQKYPSAVASDIAKADEAVFPFYLHGDTSQLRVYLPPCAYTPIMAQVPDNHFEMRLHRGGGLGAQPSEERSGVLRVWLSTGHASEAIQFLHISTQPGGG